MVADIIFGAVITAARRPSGLYNTDKGNEINMKRDDLLEMRTYELKLFIIEFNKASQLDRSFASILISKNTKKRYREILIEVCIELMQCVDDGTINNQMIREKINEVKIINRRIKYGQAQKVINVCLKQYCFITNVDDEIIDMLDCPLDSTTMKNCGIEHNKMKSVTIHDYNQYQNIFSRNYNSRILRDKDYDQKRIINFKNGTD